MSLKDLFLTDPRLTLAVAESVTSGGVQARVGRISGASNFFRGGITAYTRAQKVAHLGVDDAEAAAVDCVSAAIAEQMARGVCVLFNADIGVATTGYAEPQPYAYWAIARREGAFPRAIKSGRIDCPGLNRAQAQDRISDEAIAQLTELLRDLRHVAH